MNKSMLSLIATLCFCNVACSQVDTSVIRELDSNNKSTIVKTNYEYMLIVKFSDESIHENMTMTPEMKNKEYTPKEKIELNIPTDYNRNIGLSFLEKIYNETGLIMVHQRSLSLGYDLFLVKSDLNTSSTINKLEKTGYFKNIEVDKKISLNSIDTQPLNHKNITTETYPASFNLDMFTDNLFYAQYYLDEPSGIAKGNNDLLRASVYTTQNKLVDKVRIAVLDTGSFPHEDIVYSAGADFISSYYSNYGDCSNVDNSNNGNDATCSASNYIEKVRDNDPIDKSWSFPVDSSGNIIGDGSICIDGHGLAVSSTIAAIRDNGKGIIGGINDEDVEIVPVRVLSCEGGSGSDVVDAIVWSAGGRIVGMPNISEPVDVINLSLGGFGSTCSENSLYYQAIRFAREQGIVVVAGAGNDADDVELFTPANCGGSLAVGANDQLGDLSLFSNYGEEVDVTFTGEVILTASIFEDIYENPNSDFCYDASNNKTCYQYSSGTSFSAPLASASVAMLKLVNPSLLESEIRSIISQTAKYDYIVDIWGDEANRVSLVENAGIGNAYAAVTSNFDFTVIDNVVIENIFSNYSLDYEEEYIHGLIDLSSKYEVCNTYKISWGNYVDDVDSVRYVIYGSNTNENLTVNNSEVLYQSTSGNMTTINLNNYSRIGIQAIHNNNNGNIMEIDLSSTPKPEICSI